MTTQKNKNHNSVTKSNAQVIANELTWFESLLNQRIKSYFDHNEKFDVSSILPPKLTDKEGAYAEFVKTNKLSATSRIILIIALLPHIKPELLDSFFIQNSNISRSFTEFGGYTIAPHKGILPTVQTALFVLSANDLSARLQYIQCFEPDSTLIALGVIELDIEGGVPFSATKLTVNTNWIARLLLSKQSKPAYSSKFPAQLLSSKLDWSDLVLSQSTTQKLLHIFTWLDNAQTIMEEWSLKRHINSGYRSLFYGPPGTGKSLSACLLGKKANMDVYRVDMSTVVSKYIGETEKNLATIFDQAEKNSWILFFDEADALFAKRSFAASSNDRFANQTVAFLLQRIETFEGLVILASNSKSAIDNAFERRFQSIVHFPMPNAKERHAIWRNILNNTPSANDDIDLRYLAETFEMSGSTITNVVRFAAVHALQQQRNSFKQQDLELGIAQELKKESNFNTDTILEGDSLPNQQNEH